MNPGNLAPVVTRTSKNMAEAARVSGLIDFFRNGFCTDLYLFFFRFYYNIMLGSVTYALQSMTIYCPTTTQSNYAAVPFVQFGTQPNYMHSTTCSIVQPNQSNRGL